MDPKARLTWESIDNNIYTLDENSLTVGRSLHYIASLLIYLAFATASGRRRISSLRYLEPPELLSRSQRRCLPMDY